MNMGINKPEKLIDYLTPVNVYYTGNQGFHYRLPTGRYSNPDFVINPEFDDYGAIIESKLRKVIFHHGLHWHEDELHNRGEDLIEAWRGGTSHAPRWTVTVKYGDSTYTTPEPIQGSKRHSAQIAAKQVLESIKLRVCQRASGV